MTPERAANILISVATDWLEGITPEHLEQFKEQYGLFVSSESTDIEIAMDTMIKEFNQ